LDVDTNGALLDFAGTPSTSLYAIGSLRKGSLWESIAVPELRAQASQLAEHLVHTLLPHMRNLNRVAPETAGLDLATVAIAEDVKKEEPVL
jgi:uncharacterized NAD(P)/FAD-binding protein YdhS